MSAYAFSTASGVIDSSFESGASRDAPTLAAETGGSVVSGSSEIAYLTL